MSFSDNRKALIKRIGTAASLLGVSALVLAACGTQATPVPPTPTATTEIMAPATPTTGMTDPNSGGEVQEVKIVMKDFLFEPNQVEVNAGKVRFMVSNEGNQPHNVAFRIEGQDVMARTETFRKGEGPVTLEVDLTPGTYQMICEVPGHIQAGMVGTLVVK